MRQLDHDYDVYVRLLPLGLIAAMLVEVLETGMAHFDNRQDYAKKAYRNP
ncbi:hypothetical protein [Epibacterium ulvae]|nr:hypothetical protein [Epibacterium ulvae]